MFRTVILLVVSSDRFVCSAVVIASNTVAIAPIQSAYRHRELCSNLFARLWPRRRRRGRLAMSEPDEWGDARRNANGTTGSPWAARQRFRRSLG